MGSRRLRRLPPESAHQDVWAAMTGASVPVDGGGAMRVHFPGWRNRSAGPDFRDAVIEADGATLRGDVEVHRDARDWVRHGHDADPRYGNVVLHVVEDAPDNPPGPARRARASALAALAPEANRSPFACRPQGALGADKVRASLISVGMARYQVAADRLRLRLNDVLPDADQSRATEQSVFEEIARHSGSPGMKRRCVAARRHSRLQCFVRCLMVRRVQVIRRSKRCWLGPSTAERAA